MAKAPSVGDTVTWNTSQGKTTGKVIEKKTKDFQFDGQHFTASEDEPAFVVESEKSGKRAAHKGSALTVK
jgi:surface antigen